MSIVASLTALLKLDTQGFSSGVNSAIKQANRLNRRLTFVSRDISTAGANITALTAPLAIFGASSVKAAAKAEEQANIISRVFSEMQQEASVSIRKFADDFDLANTEAIRLVGNTSNLLTGFGFTQKAALKLSDQINRLAADLTSFDPEVTNVADASERLTKGMLGQTKALLGLKIAIRQDTAEFKNNLKEIMQQTGLRKEAARAVLIYKEALRQSQNALGDYSRTSNSFINVLRRISQRIIDLKEEFGRFLIEGLNLGEMLLKIVNGLKQLTAFVRGLSPDMKKLIARIALGLTVMGPFLLILGSIGLAVTGLVSGITALASAIAAIFSPIGLVVAALVGLGVVLIKVFDIDLKKIALKVLGFLVNIRVNFKILASYLKVLFNNIWNNLPDIARNIWNNVLVNTNVAFQKIGAVLGASFAWIKENWGVMLNNMVIALIGFIAKELRMFGNFASTLGKIMAAIGSGQFDLATSIASGLVEGFEKGMKAAKLKKGLVETINTALQETDGFVSFARGLEKIVPAFPGFITSLNTAVASLKETVAKAGPGEGDEGGGAAAITRGTISELTRGSVEAFRIRANLGLKPAEETAKNTSEMKTDIKKMIDVGVPLKDVPVYNIEGSLA